MRHLGRVPEHTAVHGIGGRAASVVAVCARQRHRVRYPHQRRGMRVLYYYQCTTCMRALDLFRSKHGATTGSESHFPLLVPTAVFAIASSSLSLTISLPHRNLLVPQLVCTCVCFSSSLCPPQHSLPSPIALSPHHILLTPHCGCATTCMQLRLFLLPLVPKALYCHHRLPFPLTITSSHINLLLACHQLLRKAARSLNRSEGDAATAKSLSALDQASLLSGEYPGSAKRSLGSVVRLA